MVRIGENKKNNHKINNEIIKIECRCRFSREGGVGWSGGRCRKVEMFAQYCCSIYLSPGYICMNLCRKKFMKFFFWYNYRKVIAQYWPSFSLLTRSWMKWQQSSTASTAGRTRKDAPSSSTSWGRARTKSWWWCRKSSTRPSATRRQTVTSVWNFPMMFYRKTWQDSYGLVLKYVDSHLLILGEGRE